jgi:hypothetical protein
MLQRNWWADTKHRKLTKTVSVESMPARETYKRFKGAEYTKLYEAATKKRGPDAAPYHGRPKHVRETRSELAQTATERERTSSSPSIEETGTPGWVFSLPVLPRLVVADIYICISIQCDGFTCCLRVALRCSSHPHRGVVEYHAKHRPPSCGHATTSGGRPAAIPQRPRRTRAGRPPAASLASSPRARRAGQPRIASRNKALGGRVAPLLPKSGCIPVPWGTTYSNATVTTVANLKVAMITNVAIEIAP